MMHDLFMTPPMEFEDIVDEIFDEEDCVDDSWSTLKTNAPNEIDRAPFYVNHAYDHAHDTPPSLESPYNGQYASYPTNGQLYNVRTRRSPEVVRNVLLGQSSSIYASWTAITAPASIPGSCYDRRGARHVNGSDLHRDVSVSTPIPRSSSHPIADSGYSATRDDMFTVSTRKKDTNCKPRISFIALIG